MKLSASTGLVLSTISTGTFPAGIVFDGSNIWVANLLSSNLTKLNAVSGASMGNFTLGSLCRASGAGSSLELSLQTVDRHGLGQVIIETRGQGTFPIALHRERGQSHHTEPA